MIGVGKIKQYSNVLDKPLSKGKQEVLDLLFSSNFRPLLRKFHLDKIDTEPSMEIENIVLIWIRI